MAHPTHSFPKQFALINGAETVTADIFAIQVISTTNTTVSVKAAGIFEQLGANGSDGNTHLANADTPDGQRTGNNLNTTHDAGFYERRSDVSTTLPSAAGNTIYGDFKSVTGASGDQILCYLK
jgi:hypothetical protein|tara:strand:- start:29205 stop:29573 length:369 start_codon:yes stop_codon:yes gene_type:complete